MNELKLSSEREGQLLKRFKNKSNEFDLCKIPCKQVCQSCVRNDIEGYDGN